MIHLTTVSLCLRMLKNLSLTNLKLCCNINCRFTCFQFIRYLLLVCYAERCSRLSDSCWSTHHRCYSHMLIFSRSRNSRIIVRSEIPVVTEIIVATEIIVLGRRDAVLSQCMSRTSSNPAVLRAKTSSPVIFDLRLQIISCSCQRHNNWLNFQYYRIRR